MCNTRTHSHTHTNTHTHTRTHTHTHTHVYICIYIYLGAWSATFCIAQQTRDVFFFFGIASLEALCVCVRACVSACVSVCVRVCSMYFDFGDLEFVVVQG